MERWLAVRFPPDQPTTVEVTDIPDDTPADITRTPAGYVIRLDTGAFERWGEELIETLIHEWAHAYVWRVHHENDASRAHDPEWGVAYATIYAAFFDNGGRKQASRFSPRPWA